MSTSNSLQQSALAVSNILDRVRAVHPDMTVLQLQFLMQVAARPGDTSRQIRMRLGVEDSTASRIVAVLSQVGSRRVEGLGLITLEESATDRREKYLKLSGGGIKLLNSLIDLLPQGDVGNDSSTKRQPVPS